MTDKRIRMEVVVNMKEPVLDELWVGVDGLETYAVSNYGRVMNVRTGKDLSVFKDASGYNHVYMYRQGKRYNVYVHLLVAQAFFLNYKSGVGVDFQNGNKDDCSVLNLTLMKAVRR